MSVLRCAYADMVHATRDARERALSESLRCESQVSCPLRCRGRDDDTLVFDSTRLSRHYDTGDMTVTVLCVGRSPPQSVGTATVRRRPRPQSGLGEHPGRDAHPGGHDQPTTRSGRRLLRGLCMRFSAAVFLAIDRSSHLYERVPAEFW